MILILLLIIAIIIYRVLNKRKAYLRLYNTLIDIASIDNVVEIKK